LPVVTCVLAAEYANVNEPLTPSLTHLSRIALNDIKICVFSKWKFLKIFILSQKQIV
jgi:hypothetical protein